MQFVPKKKKKELEYAKQYGSILIWIKCIEHFIYEIALDSLTYKVKLNSSWKFNVM